MLTSWAEDCSFLSLIRENIRWMKTYSLAASAKNLLDPEDMNYIALTFTVRTRSFVKASDFRSNLSFNLVERSVQGV